jgi:hypothetical protein
MKPVVLTPIPELADVPEQERNATVKGLLPLCHQQQAQLAAQAEQLVLQSEQIGLLKDEMAVLKGEKARPKIKPSSLNNALAGKSGSAKGKNKRRGRGKPSRKKTQALTIHDEKVIQPEAIPPGSVFKGYQTYVVQELEITLKNTK